MFDRLRILKEKGYFPDTILDIGAHHGNWTIDMKKIYELSKYYLFEARGVGGNATIVRIFFSFDLI